MSGPREGDGVLDADLRAGRDEALEHGFIVDVEDTIAFRHASIGRAVARDLLPIARTRHHAALAVALAAAPAAAARHWLAAHDPMAARLALIDAAASASERHAAADELVCLELALSLPEDAHPAAGSRRRATPASDRVDLQVRASEAAFAIGRTSARDGLPGGRDRWPRCPSRPSASGSAA